METVEKTQIGGSISLTVSCKTGVVTGGGAAVTGGTFGGAGEALRDSNPVGSPPTGWHGEAEQVAGLPTSYTLTVYVVCAP